MKTITLGSTGITVPQNCFGALPLQRIPKDEAVRLLRRAYQGGMRLFDTARAYTDSEEKVGEAFEGIRNDLFLTTKTAAKTPDDFWKDLETSLRLLRTDHVDVYQFHQTAVCYRPGDGTGMYECMQQAKKQGKIRHIGATTHRIKVAEEIIASGLYETLQYPFSYLASDREARLPLACKEKNMGFIAMKGLAGGLLTRSEVCMAFMLQFDNVAPIWGIQKENELDEWLSYFDHEPQMTEEIRAYIQEEKKNLAGDFCRGCGYCMPCTVGIQINQCARMSLMLRRAPSRNWLSPYWQNEMKKIENCVNCRICTTRCPYQLNTPELLKKNYADYQKVLAGEVSVQ